jgi:signal transduction histidine kinase
MQGELFTSFSRVLVISYFMVALIAAVDFLTGYEASSSILYLIPIYFLASNRSSSKQSVLLIALVSTLAWFIIDTFTEHPYSSQWIIFWNTFVRGAIFFSMAVAIRALRQRTQKLEQANEQLIYLNAEKNKYIGIAAHDLRSPVGNIYNLSELLLDEKSSTNLLSSQKEFISLIHRISENSLNLLDNLLDVAQIEAGTLRIQKSPQDYITFVEDTISMNRLIAEKKEQNIHLVCEMKHLAVAFDQAYLGQVLNNLLTNAMKYSFPKTTITVSIELQEEYVKTAVTDQGMGIKEQDKEKIFRPFEKAQNVPTGGERSSGLGLAIVRKIIEAHQGEIGFSSIYGQGSTFYFFLPAREVAALG